MSMSKKDFIALADALRPIVNENIRHTNGEPLVGKTVLIYSLCKFMREQNPNFKEDRWVGYLNGNCGPNGGAVKEAR